MAACAEGTACGCLSLDKQQTVPGMLSQPLSRKEHVGALLLLQPCKKKVSKQGLEEHSGPQDSGRV